MTDRERTERRPDAAGFTLIELLIALVILSVGILALAGVQTTASRDVDGSGRTTHALAVAQTHVEQIRATGYNAAVSDSGTIDVYSWNARVDSVNVGLKSVTVTVTWNEHTRNRSVQLQTLLSTR